MSELVVVQRRVGRGIGYNRLIFFLFTIFYQDYPLGEAYVPSHMWGYGYSSVFILVSTNNT